MITYLNRWSGIKIIIKANLISKNFRRVKLLLQKIQKTHSHIKDKYFLIFLISYLFSIKFILYILFQSYAMTSSQQSRGQMFDQAYYEKEYRYFKDDRTENEKHITTQLANTLSEINITRVRQGKSLPNQTIGHQLRKEDFLYVCLNGIPPYKEEFKELDLPGQTLYFCNTAYQPNLTNEQIMNAPTQFDEQAKILHQRINNRSKTKPLVFVCHSFGTYIAAAYFHLFSHDRIVGIIDISGAPLRFYPYINGAIRELIKQQEFQKIKQNIDQIYDNSKQLAKRISVSPLPSKYHLLSFIRSAINGIGFKEIFTLNRNWPKVLKCFIYGRTDSMFSANLLNQKAIFYSYQNKINPDTEKKLSLAFTKITGQKCVNIQEKYVFNVEEGYHSIHMQKKCRTLLKQIVKEYLSVIEMPNSTIPKI